MLVLSRHRDESIMIGDEIVVTIVDIRGDKVRLGIDAPRTFRSTARKSTKRSSARTARPARSSPAKRGTSASRDGCTVPESRHSRFTPRCLGHSSAVPAARSASSLGLRTGRMCAGRSLPLKPLTDRYK